MRKTLSYITLGLIISGILVAYQQSVEQVVAVEEEPFELPIVRLRHGKPADIELEIKLARAKPPLPNQYTRKSISSEPEYQLQKAEEIPAIVFAEEPSVVYQRAEVDIPAKPLRDLQLLCQQLAKNYPKLIACKSTTIRFELIIHRDGSLIDWQMGNDPYHVCESISLIFISNIQKWRPALINGKPVTQATSIHIHIKSLH